MAIFIWYMTSVIASAIVNCATSTSLNVCENFLADFILTIASLHGLRLCGLAVRGSR